MNRRPRHRHPCPCCGNSTLAEEPPGTFSICPVCWWEDDDAQAADPTLRGGANEVSLNEAAANYASIGVADPRFASRVRPPTPDERR